MSEGTVDRIEPAAPEARLPVLKRIVPRLPPPLTRFIVPYVDVTHNRIPIEIQRGCTRGCRFCQAGMITRPVRERPVAEVVDAIDQGLAQTGYEEVGLLSLSSSDYDDILELVRQVSARFAVRHLNINLPSLRIESFSVELMDLLQGEASRSGFTLAPEAATERMREIINKPVSTEQVLTTAREIYRRGWHLIKLYFMIGHPSETLEDVQAIADLSRAVLAEGRKLIGSRAAVHAGVSTFIPKPHTPFQWVPCDSLESIRAKQALLKGALRGPGLKLSWTQPEETQLEAWLSRGDRRMGKVILEAWQRGARFDAWQEHFNQDAWQQAFDAVGRVPEFYTHRERPIDETLPWDVIDAGVHKSFLTEDYLWSLQGRTRVDCRERCFACGILPKFAALRREHPGETWECPEVRSPARGKWHSRPATEERVRYHCIFARPVTIHRASDLHAFERTIGAPACPRLQPWIWPPAATCCGPLQFSAGGDRRLVGQLVEPPDACPPAKRCPPRMHFAKRRSPRDEPPSVKFAASAPRCVKSRACWLSHMQATDLPRPLITPEHPGAAGCSCLVARRRAGRPDEVMRHSVSTAATDIERISLIALPAPGTAAQIRSSSPPARR
jgi:hypothetical protein